VDAASLVFAHTVLDDALSSFVEITSDVAPGYWQHRVEKKSVELGMLKDRSWDDVLKTVIQERDSGNWTERIACEEIRIAACHLQAVKAPSQ